MLIDIVDTDPGAADDLKIVGLFQDLRRHLRGGTDGKPVIAADDRLQLVRRQAGLVVDLDPAPLKNLNGAIRNFIRNQNLGHHT